MRAKINDLPAHIALRVYSHMSPLMLNTTRTPTEGLLAGGFCDSWNLPNTDYFLRHSPLWLPWCWKRELFMKPFHSNHVPMISEFSGIIIWYKNFSKLNRTGIFCPVWILSNQTISGQKPFLLWLYSWDFFHVWVLMLENSWWKGLPPFRVFCESACESPVWAFS